jgi:hypothetical protein
MTELQKQDLFLFLQKFCADNVGNRLNEWIIETFLNRVCQKIETICKADNTVGPHDARKESVVSGQ